MTHDPSAPFPDQVEQILQQAASAISNALERSWVEALHWRALELVQAEHESNQLFVTHVLQEEGGDQCPDPQS